LKQKIDINCDLGESYGAFTVGNDAELMTHITSANIACGFHAGDPMTMARTMDLARKNNVAVGAHPGYPDIVGVGRREMHLASEEAKNYIIYQTSALQGFAKIAGVNLQHLKPHGALYNMAAENGKLSGEIVEAIQALNCNLIIFAPPMSALADVAAKAGLRVAHEFFADRAYNNDGSLVSRTRPNAIIHEPKKIVERTLKAVAEGAVLAINGEIVNLGEVHTVCVHGDNPAAVKVAEALKKGLISAGVEVRPVSSFI
jgi:UPF0271 protein